MAELLLVNPRRRRRKATKAKRRVRRKMSALQQKYFGKRKRRRRAAPARASNPRRRRRRSYASNPSPRKRRRRVITQQFRSMRRRRRSNPSFRGIGGQAVGLLKSGSIGATGAIGLDLLWGYGAKYLPASIAGSPLAQYAVKLLGAIGIGMIGNRVLRGKGSAMAIGATTVVLHDAFKAQLKASIPSLQLGEYLTFAPTYGPMPEAGRLLSTGMNGVGEYLQGLPADIGYAERSDGTYGDGDGSYNGDGMSGY